MGLQNTKGRELSLDFFLLLYYNEVLRAHENLNPALYINNNKQETGLKTVTVFEFPLLMFLANTGEACLNQILRFKNEIKFEKTVV